MSYSGLNNGSGGLQPHVVEMARSQSESLKMLIEEAGRAEDARVKQGRTTKPKHRPAMEARFERERLKEVRFRRLCCWLLGSLLHGMGVWWWWW